MKHIVVDDMVHYEAKTKSISRGMTMKEYIAFLVKKDTQAMLSVNNRIYNSWQSMMYRCYNEKHPQYKDYGGRGISVIEPLRDYIMYEKYVSELEGYGDKSLSIDRMDNNGNYDFGNLKYSTSTEQNINQRMRADNKSGYSGVAHNNVSDKWQATVRHNGKSKYLGVFKTPHEAALVRNEYIISNGLRTKLAIIDVDAEEK